MRDDETNSDWAPSACTLPTAELPLRLREFDDLFARTVIGVNRVGPTRLRLSLSGGDEVAAQVTDLTVRESECCSFFTFTLSAGEDGGLELEVQVPSSHAGVLDGLAAWARGLVEVVEPAAADWA